VLWTADDDVLNDAVVPVLGGQPREVRVQPAYDRRSGTVVDEFYVDRETGSRQHRPAQSVAVIEAVLDGQWTPVGRVADGAR